MASLLRATVGTDTRQGVRPCAREIDEFKKLTNNSKR
jgi:hypothetical protein